MMPPGWMIEELKRRREREERERPQLQVEIPEFPAVPEREPRRDERTDTPREPIVIQVW